MEFLYHVREDGICVDKASGPETEVFIPEERDGLPVTELAAYVMAGSGAETLHIPPQVRKIGAYAFYGCGKLRSVFCHGRATDLGTGIFADDRQIGFLDLTLYTGERSGMKELLQELRQTLRVRIHESRVPGEPPDPEREARLIFPEYFEESVENTPARKLAVETHGCGQRYRYCFVRREFQYADYDALFPHIQVQDTEELTAELAIGRLRYPRGLGEKSRARYEAYLRGHWEAAARILLAADRPSRKQISNLEPGWLPWLVEEILPGGAGAAGARAEMQAQLASQLTGMTAMAQRLGDTEMVSYLMDFAHRIQPESAASRRRRFSL